MADKDKHVDKEFKDELELIENRLALSMEKLITNLIKQGMKEIKTSLTEIVGKDIEHVKETIDRHSKHHDKHFNEITKIKENIDTKVHIIVDDRFKLLESIINSVKETQIKCQASEKTKDKIEDKTDRKKNTNYGFIVMLCAIFTVIGIMIGFVI